MCSHLSEFVKWVTFKIDQGMSPDDLKKAIAEKHTDMMGKNVSCAVDDMCRIAGEIDALNA